MASKPQRDSRVGKRQSKQKSDAPIILPPPASLDARRLKQLYSTMLRCRLIAERARLLVEQGTLEQGISVATGYEALEVGALINLGLGDCVAAGGREYIARFIQGASLRRIFAELRSQPSVVSRERAAGDGRVDMMVPGSAGNGQQHLLAGAAWAFKLHQRPQVAVFLCDDHSAPDNSWRDAVRFSADYHLPIVHIVESKWETPEAAESPGSQSQNLGAPLELPCFIVDVSDAVAVYRVAQEAIRRARQGHGPALIECRSSSPEDAGTTHEDPLPKMEAHLRSRGLWSDSWKTKITQRMARELDRAAAVSGRDFTRAFT